MRPVHVTVSPSEICSYSPRITAPTESRSRLSARPKVLPGNSSISPCIASESPWMRLMPSESETTVPWVRTWASVPALWILLLISSLISDGFNCMICPRASRVPLAHPTASVSISRPQIVGHRLQFAPDRRVDDRIADDDLGSADELGIDADRRLDFLSEAPLERRFK